MSDTQTAAPAIEVPTLNGVQLNNIDPRVVAKLNSLVSEIRAVTKGTDVTIASEEADKDAAYTKVQLLWNEYAETLRTAQFRFALNRDQYDYLLDVITKQLTYSVDEVFVAIKFRQEFFDLYTPAVGSRRQVTNYPLTSETMVMAYHLLAKHKVKGLGTTADHFTHILRGIGAVSTEYNAFDNESKRLSAEIADFSAGITDLDENYTAGLTDEAAQDTTPATA